MSYQSTIGEPKAETEPVPVTDHVVNLASDLITLVELQSRLLGLDWAASRPRLVYAITALCVSGALIIGSMPILTVCIAWWLAMLFDISFPLLVTVFSLLTIVASTAGIASAYQSLTAAAKSFERSQFELSANLRWIKSAIEQSGTSKRL